MDDRYIKFESQKKNADDCAIRAMMKLTDRDWITCYDELCDLGIKKKRMPNEWKIIELWLKIMVILNVHLGNCIKDSIV